MNIREENGFTLIELMVVISIIGMLSSVVFASLSAARDKANVAAGDIFARHTDDAYGLDALGIWNFDGDTFDSSGNNRNGVISGASSYSTDHRNVANKALVFNGSNTYVDFGSISVANDITVAMWVYSTNFSQNGYLIGRNPVNTQWGLFLESSSGIVWRSGASLDLLSTCSAPSNNSWHHIAATQSGLKYAIYIDGRLCKSGTRSLPIANTGTSVQIGVYSGSGYPFSGKIDEARLYSQSLVASDIEKLYAEGYSRHVAGVDWSSD